MGMRKVDCICTRKDKKDRPLSKFALAPMNSKRICRVK